MRNALLYRMMRIAGVSCLLAALTTQAADLIPHPEANAKFKVMEKSIFLYEGKPYTIEQAIAKNEVAGLSLVILYEGKPAIHRWYGYRIKTKEEKTTSKTIYSVRVHEQDGLVLGHRHRRAAGRVAA